MINLKNCIIDLYDYARCCLTSKAGIYQAIYIQKQVLSIGDKKQVNITYQDVVFDDNDVPDLPNNPVVVNKPDLSVVELSCVRDLLYDDDNSIVYILNARTYGGKEGRDYASGIDNKKQCKKHRKMLFSFFCFLANNNSDNSRIGTIKAMPPIKYKDVVGAN